MNILRQNKVLLIILVIIVLALAWFGMSDRSQPTGLLVGQAQTGTAAIDQEILRLLLDMRSIRLDGAVFETPAFLLLRDFGRDIVPEPVGRPNPFAPVQGTPSVDSSGADVFLQ